MSYYIHVDRDRHISYSFISFTTYIFRNVSLLSFGEAEETLPMDDATRTTKIKSSHDLLVNDPRLKKEAVVAAAAAAPPTAIHGESNGLHNKDSRASKQPPPKKSIAISRRNDDDDESNDQDGEKGFTQRQAEKKL